MCVHAHADGRRITAAPICLQFSRKAFVERSSLPSYETPSGKNNSPGFHVESIVSPLRNDIVRALVRFRFTDPCSDLNLAPISELVPIRPSRVLHGSVTLGVSPTERIIMSPRDVSSRSAAPVNTSRCLSLTQRPRTETLRLKRQRAHSR